MKPIISYSLVIILLFLGCVSNKREEKTITISGAYALYPLVVKWSEEYIKEHPKVRFDITSGGAGKGMEDVLTGSVDLGMFSKEITEEEKNKGIWWVGLSVDAVVPTISNQNPYLEKLKERGLTREKLRAVFIEKTITDWGDLLESENKMELTIYTRSDECGAAETWANYLGGKQENLKGKGIYSDPALARMVAKDITGIAFNNTAFVYDNKTEEKRLGLEVIPIDINGNGKIDPEEDFYGSFDAILTAIENGIYPSPPARELYFVSKGKPEKQATLDFIMWTLTDGQKYVKNAGYVPIEKSRINSYLETIK